MGFIDRNVSKGHQRQKESLLKEATATGLQVLQVHEIGTAGAAIGSTLKAMFGGKLAPDVHQIFDLGWGEMRLLYVQPYSGMTVLPGEHHCWLHGAFRAPLALTDTAVFGGPSWEAGPDEELATWLSKSNPFLKQVTKRCEFLWAIGMGKIELEWAVQLRSLGNGTTHLVMQPGRYGGITTYKVGFAQLCALIQALGPLLPQAAEPLHQPLHPVNYTDLFETYLLGVAPTQEPAPMTAPPEDAAWPVPGATTTGATPNALADYSERIRALAAPFEGKKVHVTSVPEKKERNARKVVLPDHAQGELIVALFDLTTFGSAKDGVVFTPTHCFAHEIDDRAAFPLADLEAVHGFDGMLESKISVEIRGIGKLTVPCGTVGDQLLTVFQGLVG